MSRPFPRPVLALGVLLAGGACSGSGGGGGAAPAASADFRVLSISVRNAQVWELNRPIEIAFSEPVNFLSVGTDTIRIRTPAGVPATGSFLQKRLDTDGDGVPDAVDPTVIVWQPTCPVLPDLSDAGLRPGGVRYDLQVVGRDASSTNPVLAGSGRQLAVSQFRTFRTPVGSNDSLTFMDPVPGDPRPVVRPRSGGGAAPRLEGVSYVEVGGRADVASRIYFERDDASAVNTVHPPGSVVPLNLYADPDTSMAVVLAFNQPVNPRARNFTGDRLRLEYLVDELADAWVPIETRARLVANCAGSGATVRLEPVGILPARSRVRVAVGAGFEGIVGPADATSGGQDLFGRVDTATVSYASLTPAETGADEYFEEFAFGGAGVGSFEDTGAVFEVPAARWGGGALEARLEFPGTGGPGGDFDWIVRDTPETFDTSSQTIVGGPGGTRGREQFTTGGVVDVRDFHVLPGAELRVQGPNPMVLNATGEVRIEGRIVVSGYSARDVATLNTGSQPEKGGAGAAGGGDGGTASEVRNNSTPRGGPGFGPLGQIGTGGRGGESGYNAGASANSRRPGGGGGGRFAPDASDATARSQQNNPPETQVSRGMLATAGLPGHPQSSGAVTGLKPAMGGDAGGGAFGDGNDANDFFGVKPDRDVTIPVSGAPPVAGPLRGLIRGELTGLHAGYGGGAGGDAIPANTFPSPNWTVSSDEKGGGGGGAGGALHVRALGPILFLGDEARLSSRGGQGGLGENSSGFDRIGGTGGTGSGGHLVLESASRIEFVLGTRTRNIFIDTRGGRGKVDVGNPNVQPGVSEGGDGGPGLIQLHVPDPITPPQADPDVTDIVVPAQAVADLDAGDVDVLLEVMRPAGVQMIPNYGAVTRARSRWIDLGGADFDAGGGSDLVRFLFRGTDPASGRILTDGSEGVQELPPVLGPALLSATASVLADGLTLRLVGPELDPWVSSTAEISEDLYLRTPALLRNFVLRLTGDGLVPLDFPIQAATYDDDERVLDLAVAQVGTATLASFAAAAPATAAYEVVPRFFRVATNGVLDRLPDSASVRITFEGAEVRNGVPLEEPLLVEATGDARELYQVAPGRLRFFRILYEFDLNAQGQGLGASTPEVRLEFLRLPFVF